MVQRNLIIVAALAAAIGCGRKDGGGDTAPPVFGGIESAEILDVGTARLTWSPAEDPGHPEAPIAYDIFHATSPGGEDFAVASALETVTDETEVVIENLHPGAGLHHYFVVRARDEIGNSDQNTKERDVVFQANGISLLGRYDMPVTGDLAVDDANGVAVVSGWYNEQIALIDVSDRKNPTELTTLENVGYGADVQIKDSYLYAAHEYAGRGFDIYDISSPASPQLLKQVGPNTGYPADLEDCHNLWPQPDRGLLYCASTATGTLVVLSTGDTGQGSPDDPVFVTTIPAPPQGEYGVHDMYALGNRLYVAWLDAGMEIFDVTDPAAPVSLGTKTYTRAFTHNLWPNEDGTVLFSTDENNDGHLRIWDISDPADIQQIGEYQANPAAIIHNVEVVGNLAYISYYTEGMKVVDVSDPTAPVEVGAHDFYDGPDSAGFEGNWGVDPHPPYVYASGMASGLYVYEFSAPSIGAPEE